jgi:hypothetical protein
VMEDFNCKTYLLDCQDKNLEDGGFFRTLLPTYFFRINSFLSSVNKNFKLFSISEGQMQSQWIIEL